MKGIEEKNHEEMIFPLLKMRIENRRLISAVFV